LPRRAAPSVRQTTGKPAPMRPSVQSAWAISGTLKTNCATPPTRSAAIGSNGDDGSIDRPVFALLFGDDLPPNPASSEDGVGAATRSGRRSDIVSRLGGKQRSRGERALN